ncbi:PepSY domain-containing protein [Ornithinicoccus hortensis]|uniref:Putative membrane protein YkoI n=1 Tax=Ornithinicoccus hortensis TaxID=82346 RepID=A0A542YUL5_9MICO|nr:PepSY domain-containing protein [Ornithinicoccus hortensis]TQL51776.1 putative membrane protein YkoI [Ornithinicoccus hortensis]
MKRSRIATGSLAGLLALTLAGCGDNSDETTAGVSAPASSDAAEGEATPADEGADTTTPDDGADDAATSSDAAAETGGDDASATTEAAAGGATDAEEQLARLEAVIAVAEGEAGGTAYEIDDQDDDGSWEVDVAVGDRSIEVTVSADGQVVETEEDDLDEDDRDALAAATITIVDAAAAGLDEVDGTLDDIELDEEDGTFAWEVTIDTADDDDVEVYVDVTTGEVIRVDRD